MKTPRHVAIIMDGNGRWAQYRGRPRAWGHIRGASAAKKIITAAVELKIEYLTLFTFSTENWQRPESEIRLLMRLLKHQIVREQARLMKNNVRFLVIGDLEPLPADVRIAVDSTIEKTKNNTGLTLTFALNYGGRQEILTAAKTMARLACEGTLNPLTVTEESFAQLLPSFPLPDPDLIIRTSGEQRLSNFLLWQAAYSEIIISPDLWPDFTGKHLELALATFASRRRRFGRIDESENSRNLSV